MSSTTLIPSIQVLFAQASILTGTEFLGKLNYYASAWLPARDLLISSVAASKASVDSTGQIILFEQFLPWKVISFLNLFLHLSDIYLRSICLNWKRTTVTQSSRLTKPYILFTQMKRRRIGAFRLFLYLRKALKAGKHYLKLGGA